MSANEHKMAAANPAGRRYAVDTIIQWSFFAPPIPFAPERPEIQEMKDSSGCGDSKTRCGDGGVISRLTWDHFVTREPVPDVARYGFAGSSRHASSFRTTRVETLLALTRHLVPSSTNAAGDSGLAPTRAPE
jgi:hypothetical protein